MSQLTRKEEDRLKELRGKESAGTLSEEDHLHLSLLEDRYTLFLDEGLKKLREKSPAGQAGSPKEVLSGLFRRARFKTAVKASTPLADTASSARHWSWITTRIVLGAVPYAANSPDNCGHLLSLKSQCDQRKITMGLVVSCIGIEEYSDASMDGFAQPPDWESVLSVSAFVHLPFPHDDIDLTHDEMQACVDHIEKAIDQDKAVYIHCLAGLSRSWLVVMCYLISGENMTYDNALDLIASRRPFVNPSDNQIAFAKSFEQFAIERAAKRKEEQAKDRLALPQKRSDMDEKYYEILTLVLSMPIEYRTRLAQDLDKLS